MLEPPSDALVAGLSRLGLCRAADWRRARSRVRRLARDLPAFDSVWIDALVTLRRLTPFQARLIEDDRLDELAVGPCLLLDELGRGKRNRSWLAEHRGRQERCVAKRIFVEPDQFIAVRQRLQQLVDRAGGLSAPQVVVPSLCEADGQSLMTVSAWTSGVTLSELLVRRGRFPPGVVLDLARHLLAGLAALHERQLLHGDLRLSNIRLREDGVAVMVDAGIRPAVAPDLQLHDALSPEAFDTIAPELIGSGLPRTPAADLYAVGCVLWQLLAGRPPFPVADPLEKLAAHQTGRVPDVRDWAPQTPTPLAELIQSLTEPNPQQRPDRAASVLDQIGWPGLSVRSRLRKFRRLFDGAVPHLTPSVGPAISGWAWTAAALFLVCGAVFALRNTETRSQLLSLWNPQAPSGTSSAVELSAVVPAGSPDTIEPGTLLSLPRPDAEGVLLLKQNGDYTPRDLEQVGPLHIRAADGVHAVLKIGDQPWKITARELTLENLALQQVLPALDSTPLKALVLVRAQSLNLRNLKVTSSLEDSAQPSSGDPAPSFAWTQLDRQDRQAGLAQLQNVVAMRPGALLFCREAPRDLRLENCLKTQAGPAIVVYQSSAARPLRLSLSRVTLRQTGPLISLWGDFPQQTGAARLEIEATEAVFALSESPTGLIELVAERLRPDWAQIITWTGESSLISPGLELAAHRDPARNVVERLDTTQVAVDGLTVDEFEFRGPLSTDPGASHIIRSQAPRLSPELPGYRAQ